MVLWGSYIFELIVVYIIALLVCNAIVFREKLMKLQVGFFFCLLSFSLGTDFIALFADPHANTAVSAAEKALLGPNCVLSHTAVINTQEERCKCRRKFLKKKPLTWLIAWDRAGG